MADHEKLTETIGVKLSETTLRQVRAVADVNGMEVSTFIRSLVESAVEKERARYASLHFIFGADLQETKGNEG
jgi:hypothetical protein